MDKISNRHVWLPPPPEIKCLSVLLMAVVSAHILLFGVTLTWRDIGSFWVMWFSLFSFSFFGAAAHSCGRLTWAAPAGLRQNSKLLISELTWQVTKHSVNSEQHCWFSVAHLLALCCFFSGHFEMYGLQTLPHACKTEAALEDEDRHQLYLYLCCRHTPQWPSSIWRSAPGRGWLYWGRRNRGTGWHSTSPCCLTLDASTWSGCGALQEHCR